jgi:hypothetical protein
MGNNVENYLKKYATVVFVKGEGNWIRENSKAFLSASFLAIKKDQSQ